MRQPSVAGQFYADDEVSLRAQIEKCFTGPLGPGKIPKLSQRRGEIVGGVVPHAGYMYSGMVAAHTYARIV